MASLWLPAPTRTGPSSSPKAPAAVPPRNNGSVRASVHVLAAPSYEERCRAASELAANKKSNNSSKAAAAAATSTSLFVPRSLKDFDDGGAFPEIHIAQYPRHMGNPHLKKKRPAAGAGGAGVGGQARGAQSRS
eukprot:scaffold107036_cov31-Attheya_sp.AAC.1